MENWMHSFHGLGEMDCMRVRAQLHNDDERPKVLFGKFFGGSCRMEVLGFDINRTTNLERRHIHVLHICRALVLLLCKGHLFTKEMME
jgi:hypothetical protein